MTDETKIEATAPCKVLTLRSLKLKLMRSKSKKDAYVHLGGGLFLAPGRRIVLRLDKVRQNAKFVISAVQSKALEVRTPDHRILSAADLQQLLLGEGVAEAPAEKAEEKVEAKPSEAAVVVEADTGEAGGPEEAVAGEGAEDDTAGDAGDSVGDEEGGEGDGSSADAPSGKRGKRRKK